AARRGWKPIRPCFCVHDSPQSPCPCDNRILWWLSEKAIMDTGASGREDAEGKDLQHFDVAVESQILMESVQSVSAGTLQRLESSPSFKQFRELVATTGGVSTHR